MAIRNLQDIRAVGVPPYCSSCFGQQLDHTHISFDAECDRGILYGDDSATKVYMDRLILCDECVKHAGRVLGMIDEDVYKDKLESLERRLKDETNRAEQAVAYSERLEGAFNTRPSGPVKASRPRGRPKTAKTQRLATAGAAA